MIGALARLGARARGVASAADALWTGTLHQTILVETTTPALRARALLYPSGDLDHRLRVTPGASSEAVRDALSRHRARLAGAVVTRQARIAALLALPWVAVAPLAAAWVGLEVAVGAPIDELQRAWEAALATPWTRWPAHPAVQHAVVAAGARGLWLVVRGAAVAAAGRALLRAAARWVARRARAV